MSPAPQLSSRLRLAEEGAKVDLKRTRVTIEELLFSSVTDVRSDAVGKLVFSKPLRPGRYVIDVDIRSLPDGCFVMDGTKS